MRRTAVAWVLVLAGCGGGSTDGVVGEPAGSASPGPVTALTVELVRTQNGAAETSTLTCDPPGGSNADPATACADLALETTPFAPLDTSAACTEIYGGPQTAIVSGLYRGEPVELRLARSDGCCIAQWDRLGALLPTVVGAS